MIQTDVKPKRRRTLTTAERQAAIDHRLSQMPHAYRQTYRTAVTGNWPGWATITRVANNMVSRLVVWRLDRLGRTASGLTKLFDELQDRKVHFESVMDRIDSGTTAGRLIANVLASVAAYETEIRAEAAFMPVSQGVLST